MGQEPNGAQNKCVLPTPVWKKDWFWAAIGGTILVFAGVAGKLAHMNCQRQVKEQATVSKEILKTAKNIETSVSSKNLDLNSLSGEAPPRGSQKDMVAKSKLKTIV
jgi:hypothetical protein